MAKKKLSFYDMKARKKVMVDEDDVEYVVKKTKRGDMRFAVAEGKAGNKLYRVMGKA